MQKGIAPNGVKPLLFGILGRINRILNQDLWQQLKDSETKLESERNRSENLLKRIHDLENANEDLCVYARKWQRMGSDAVERMKSLRRSRGQLLRNRRELV